MQKTTEQKAAGRPARLNYKMKTQLQLYALLAPVLILIFIFCYLPLYGLLIAFQDWYPGMPFLDFTGATKWVGLKHFISFFQNPYFWRLIKNTLVLSALNLGVAFWIPIGFALLINELRLVKFKKFAQTASYLPYFISWVVVAGLLQVFVSSTGALNNLLAGAGWIEKPLEILTSPDYFYGLAVITAIWKDTGWWTIIFLAAITGIDPTLYEAADMDGATRMQKMRYITFPSIAGTVTVVLILALGNLLGGGLSGSNFEQCYLLGNAGNIDNSDIIQTYVMRVGLVNARYSYATAVGMFQSVISVVLVYTSNFISKRISGNGLF